MTEPFLGEVQIFGFPFAPMNWAFAAGQTLPIQQNGALFGLFGAQFGGNGSTTFQLPNLAARGACGAGMSPGNSQREMGQSFGSFTVALQPQDMPPHSHLFNDFQPGDPSQLAGAPAATAGLGYAIKERINPFATPGSAATMDPNAIGMAGNGAPHPNTQPFLGLNYCVALMGQYPQFD